MIADTPIFIDGEKASALINATMEAETLLTNYLAQKKFPLGSDCEEVRDQLRSALRKLREPITIFASTRDIISPIPMDK